MFSCYCHCLDIICFITTQHCSHNIYLGWCGGVLPGPLLARPGRGVQAAGVPCPGCPALVATLSRARPVSPGQEASKSPQGVATAFAGSSVLEIEHCKYVLKVLRYSLLCSILTGSL